MMTTSTQRDSCDHAADWLDQRLSQEEQAFLANNGFVSQERLPSGSTAYKLRFRRSDRRQRVLYVGTNTRLAAAIRVELQRRQSPLRRRRQHRKLTAAARSSLRELKRRIEPALTSRGIYFHGFEFRLRRSARERRPNRSHQ